MSIALNSDVELVSMLIKFEELIGFVQYSSIHLMPNSWIYVCLLIINSFQITSVLISCCVYTPSSCIRYNSIPCTCLIADFQIEICFLDINFFLLLKLLSLVTLYFLFVLIQKLDRALNCVLRMKGITPINYQYNAF